MGKGEGGAPRVFVSYSHDDDEHRRRALLLTRRLRSVHVDAWIDRYVENDPPASWPHWMFQELERSDFVIMICTEIYKRRVQGQEVPGAGYGAAWEGSIITHNLYQGLAFAETSPYIPVVFQQSDLAHIPYFVAGASHYLIDVDDNTGLDGLVRRLLHEPEIVPHPLGAPLDASSRTHLAHSRSSGADPSPEAYLQLRRKPQGVAAAPLGSASEATRRLPATITALLYEALVAAEAGADQGQLLFSLREVLTQFGQRLVGTSKIVPPPTVSLWATSMSPQADEAEVQLLLRTASDESPHGASQLEIGESRSVLMLPTLLEATFSDLKASERMGVQRRPGSAIWEASWPITIKSDNDAWGEAFEGFLQVETTKALSRHFRQMGQDLADRLAPLFPHLRRASAKASG